MSDEHPGATRGSRWRRRTEFDRGTAHHPAVVHHLQARAEHSQLRFADKITSLAGSMSFVYLHAGFFAVWMLAFENSPWPTLTLTVSLEAIFLSTFVLIGQNRQTAFQQAKADHDYQNVNTLLEENTALTREIHELARDVRDRLLNGATTDEGPDRGQPSRNRQTGPMQGSSYPHDEHGRL